VFSPDGKTLAWSSMARDGYESDKNRIMLMDLATRKSRELTVDFDDNADHVTWSPDGKMIYFVAGVRATYHVHSIDVATGAIAQLTNGKHNFNSVHVYAERLMGSMVNMSMPSELFEINPETRVHTQLTRINGPVLDQVAMGEVQERTVKTSDGKEMLVWVILPPDFDPNKKYPTLLYCQGGPQSAVSQFFSYRWNFQLMAAYGYVVVAPNRRGLPSFGTKWNEEISGDWGGQAMCDYLSAIDDVAKEPWADETRMGAVGASYGGYSV
jgi:dipeptidyl aminopeptidase/acylaminoacyl peptidase